MSVFSETLAGMRSSFREGFSSGTFKNSAIFSGKNKAAVAGMFKKSSEAINKMRASAGFGIGMASKTIGSYARWSGYGAGIGTVAALSDQVMGGGQHLGVLESAKRGALYGAGLRGIGSAWKMGRAARAVTAAGVGYAGISAARDRRR